MIAGGHELSSYPDRCVLQIERRTVIGESAGRAVDEVETILADLRAEDSQFRGSLRLMVDRAPYEIAEDHGVVTALEGVMNRMGRRPERIGLSFWTDAARLGPAGIPAVVFGPG